VFSEAECFLAGRITTVFGLKGWVKLRSFLDPCDNVFHYASWWFQFSSGLKECQIAGHTQGKYLVAHIDGCDDRDSAYAFCGVNFFIPKDQLPALSMGQYYWHQLEGLQVYNMADVLLGRVHHLLPTSAHDVLVVRQAKRELLIPYVSDVVVKKVLLSEQKMMVDWDENFL